MILTPWKLKLII